MNRLLYFGLVLEYTIDFGLHARKKLMTVRVFMKLIPVVSFVERIYIVQSGYGVSMKECLLYYSTTAFYN